MFRNRFIVSGVFLLLAALALAACGASGGQDSAAVSSAVKATLTAVAAENVPVASPQSAQDSSQASPASTPIAPARVALPPLVNGFDPEPRPASAKGDPNAPVVIYEWSDYT